MERVGRARGRWVSFPLNALACSPCHLVLDLAGFLHGFLDGGILDSSIGLSPVGGPRRSIIGAVGRGTTALFGKRRCLLWGFNGGEAESYPPRLAQPFACG